MLICLYIFSGVYSLSEQNEAYSVSFFSLLLDAFDYPRLSKSVSEMIQAIPVHSEKTSCTVCI